MSLLENALASDAYTPVNKKLSREIWAIPTLYLMEMLSQRRRFGGNWFYFSGSQMENELWFSEQEQKTARTKLKSLGIISFKKKWLPAKNYYTIHDEVLIKFLGTTSQLPEASQSVASNSLVGWEQPTKIINNTNNKNNNNNNNHNNTNDNNNNINDKHNNHNNDNNNNNDDNNNNEQKKKHTTNNKNHNNRKERDAPQKFEKIFIKHYEQLANRKPWEEVLAARREFTEMRKKKRAPINTEWAVKRLVNKLFEISKVEKTHTEIIAQSTMSSRTWFFETAKMKDAKREHDTKMRNENFKFSIGKEKESQQMKARENQSSGFLDELLSKI